jgi:hypothetical protein
VPQSLSVVVVELLAGESCIVSCCLVRSFSSLNDGDLKPVDFPVRHVAQKKIHYYQARKNVVSMQELWQMIVWGLNEQSGFPDKLIKYICISWFLKSVF